MIRRGPRALLHPHPAVSTAAAPLSPDRTSPSSSLSPQQVYHHKAVRMDPEHQINMLEPLPTDQRVLSINQKRPDETPTVQSVAAVPAQQKLQQPVLAEAAALPCRRPVLAKPTDPSTEWSPPKPVDRPPLYGTAALVPRSPAQGMLHAVDAASAAALCGVSVVFCCPGCC